MRQIAAKGMVSEEDVRSVDIAEEAHAEQDVVRIVLLAREEVVGAEGRVSDDADTILLLDQGVGDELDDVERVDRVLLAAVALVSAPDVFEGERGDLRKTKEMLALALQGTIQLSIPASHGVLRMLPLYLTAPGMDP